MAGLWDTCPECDAASARAMEGILLGSYSFGLPTTASYSASIIPAYPSKIKCLVLASNTLYTSASCFMPGISGNVRVNIACVSQMYCKVHQYITPIWTNACTLCSVGPRVGKEKELRSTQIRYEPG